MDSEDSKNDLKKRLQREVSRLYKRDKRLWKEPIDQTLRELQKTNLQAVFFGGTLRSLLISRLFARKLGRPRDVDIVVSGASIDALKKQFAEILTRETRFGGLQLRRREWQFDIWPLHQTWAFVRDSIAQPAFSELPSTTFFNLEAIAVEVWPRRGHARQVFSGDDQFFDGILTKTLEINREENPFPELCVVRALVMASSLDFAIGPTLARYIVQHGQPLTEQDLEYVQQKHYGVRRRYGRIFREWIDWIADRLSENTMKSIQLPMSRQLQLWRDDDEARRITVHSIGRTADSS